MHMERAIGRTIVERYCAKLTARLDNDVIAVGGGPSALVAATIIAAEGYRVTVLERNLAPGGGVWGGGMLFNEVAVEQDTLPILERFGIASEPAGDGLHACDAVQLAAGLIYGACKAGVVILNGISVEDVVYKDGRIGGVVVNWTPVVRQQMHVDPLMLTARVVLDGTGHPSEVAALAIRKAGVRLDTPTGGIVGERAMWAVEGEHTTVENTRCYFPGLYASGMAANNIAGGYRMGPVFGGMLRSGEKAAQLILAELRESS